MVASFQAQAAILVIASPFAGSFLGTVIDRIARNEPFSWTRSRCRSCDCALLPCDLVPIGSFLALRGCCRRCGAAIPRELLTIELSFVVATIACVALVAADIVVFGAVLTWGLLALAWCDIRHGRLPDLLTLPLGIGAPAVALFVGAPIADRVIGASIGLALPALTAYAYRRWRGHDGLGAGDVKLFGALGAWVGWEALPVVLLLSSAGALAFAGLRGRISSKQSLPFGPFIAAAGWLTWVFVPWGAPS